MVEVAARIAFDDAHVIVLARGPRKKEGRGKQLRHGRKRSQPKGGRRAVAAVGNGCLLCAEGDCTRHDADSCPCSPNRDEGGRKLCGPHRALPPEAEMVRLKVV